MARTSPYRRRQPLLLQQQFLRQPAQAGRHHGVRPTSESVKLCKEIGLKKRKQWQITADRAQQGLLWTINNTVWRARPHHGTCALIYIGDVDDRKSTKAKAQARKGEGPEWWNTRSLLDRQNSKAL